MRGGSTELSQLQGPPQLGLSQSMLLSGSLKEFGDRSYPFLSSPVSGPGVKTQPSSSQRGAETSWALLSGPYSGPDGKQRIGWFFVASGSWLGLKEPLLQNSQHNVAVESLRRGLAGDRVGKKGQHGWRVAPGFGQPCAEADEA